MRASDCRTSLSQLDSVSVPSGLLHAITFTADGVERSTGGGSASAQTIESWIPLPRLTIEVSDGSDAAQRYAGWVKMPLRPCDVGQVAATQVESLVGALPPE